MLELRLRGRERAFRAGQPPLGGQSLLPTSLTMPSSGRICWASFRISFRSPGRSRTSCPGCTVPRRPRPRRPGTLGHLQPAPAHLFGGCRNGLACVHAALPSAIAGGSTLQQPHSVTSLVSDWQYLHTWFCPVEPLPPAALALCPAVLAFFRLRFAPFLLSRHAEEDFWQRFGQQFNVPHSSFTALALNKLSSSSSSSSLNKYIPSHRMVTSRSHGPQEGQDGPHGE